LVPNLRRLTNAGKNFQSGFDPPRKKLGEAEFADGEAKPGDAEDAAPRAKKLAVGVVGFVRLTDDELARSTFQVLAAPGGGL
jgi:hypothetical protein